MIINTSEVDRHCHSIQREEKEQAIQDRFVQHFEVKKILQMTAKKRHLVP